MYTVVNPTEKASCLKKYTKKQITVIDQEVNAWVLNEEEGLYLLYAMNWNGDTNLYCYVTMKNVSRDILQKMM